MRAALNDIAVLTSSFFADVDLVASDILAGLLLLVHAPHQLPPATTHTPGTEVFFDQKLPTNKFFFPKFIIIFDAMIHEIAASSVLDCIWNAESCYFFFFHFIIALTSAALPDGQLFGNPNSRGKMSVVQRLSVDCV
ncbi:unnamed protein product [Gongylonema pulchrum]|uniref:Secreted protein n=1 Tax=Gongylonema pulchrum TaxID=637853 RepID=A0A183CWN1_9BILA|nr:unnamed protein product [Gongylonema pulchrum]